VVEYELNTTLVGLNDDMGFALGCMVGGTTTQIFLVAKLLEDVDAPWKENRHNTLAREEGPQPSRERVGPPIELVVGDESSVRPPPSWRDVEGNPVGPVSGGSGEELVQQPVRAGGSGTHCVVRLRRGHADIAIGWARGSNVRRSARRADRIGRNCSRSTGVR